MSVRAPRLVLLLALVPNALVAQEPSRDAPAPAGKGIIRGVVTAADTGGPIRNASVFIQDGDPTAGLETRSVFTDAQGRYEISRLKGGRYSVSASKPGYQPRSYGPPL